MIPPDIRIAVKDLLRFREDDPEVDNILEGVYVRVLDEIVRTTDWLCERLLVSTQANVRQYGVPSRTARVLAVLHDRSHLAKIIANSVDHLNVAWESAASGAPEEWWINQVANADPVPDTFIVNPAPVGAASGLSGFLLYLIARPSTDNPTVRWIRPLLIYRTVAGFYAGSHCYRDQPTSDYFTLLANTWEQVLKGRIPYL